MMSADGNIISLQLPVAEALYDNLADTIDELAFKKGDSLLVLDQNPEGLEGWWDCEIGGRRGIVPANRLRILPAPNLAKRVVGRPSHYDLVPPHPMSVGGDYDVLHGNGQPEEFYDHPPLQQQRQSPQLVRPMSTQRSSASLSNRSSNGSMDAVVVRSERHGNPAVSMEPQSFYDSPPLRGAEAAPVGMVKGDANDVYRPARTPVGVGSTYDMVPNSSQPPLPPPHSRNIVLAPITANDTVTAFVYDRPPSGSDLHPFSSDRPQSSSDRPQPGSDRSQSGSDHPQSGSDRPQSGSDRPQSGSRPQSGAETRSIDDLLEAARLASSAPTSSQPSRRNSQRDHAIDSLVKLEQKLGAAISNLISFKQPNWSDPAVLTPSRLSLLRKAVSLLTTGVREFSEFCRECCYFCCEINATLYSELSQNTAILDRCYSKLIELGGVLEQSSRLAELTQSLSEGFDISMSLSNVTSGLSQRLQSNLHVIFPDHADKAAPLPPPALPPILPPSVQRRPLPAPPVDRSTIPPNLQPNAANTSKLFYENQLFMEQYDDAALRATQELSPNRLYDRPSNASVYDRLQSDLSLPTTKTTVYASATPSNTIATSGNIAAGNAAATTAPSDRTTAAIYTRQLDDLIPALTQTVDAFLRSLANQQPPKVFIAYTKFVVICAHKVIYVGDAAREGLRGAEFRDRVAIATETLSERLRHAVLASKAAALQFPNPTAIQDMVGQIAGLSGTANHLRELLRSQS